MGIGLFCVRRKDGGTIRGGIVVRADGDPDMLLYLSSHPLSCNFSQLIDGS